MAVTKNNRRPDATLRRAVFARDGHSCAYCGSREDLTLDHVTPWSKGGQTVASNLIVACSECNRAKSDWPVSLFAQRLEMEGRGTTATILGRIYRRLTRPMQE